MRALLPFLALLLPALTTEAAAQCQTIPGSGCHGATAGPHCVTPPRIGTRFSAECPSCGHTATSFAIVGTPLHSPIVFGPPATCGERCSLHCSVLALVRGGSVQFHIPNDHHLVGFALCLQCACVDGHAGCFTLSLATRVTISA